MNLLYVDVMACTFSTSPRGSWQSSAIRPMSRTSSASSTNVSVSFLVSMPSFVSQNGRMSSPRSSPLLVGVDKAGQLKPVDDFESRRQWIEQAVTNYLVPSTIKVRMHPIPVDGGIVIAINVWPEERLVSLYDRQSHQIEVLRRTNHGKEWMNPDEAEAHRMNAGRAKRLAFERIAYGFGNARNFGVKLTSGIWFWSSSAQVGPHLKKFGRFTVGSALGGEHEFELIVSKLADTDKIKIALPYTLIEHIWRIDDETMGLHLTSKLSYDGTGLTVESR